MAKFTDVDIKVSAEIMKSFPVVFMCALLSSVLGLQGLSPYRQVSIHEYNILQTSYTDSGIVLTDHDC